ncbi:MAG: LysR family transcriptional regulator [Pseudomonadota bacterium]
MNWQAIAFDWNQVRAFLATAEEGSLSAAARALGTTQPTVGRQIAALEGSLGVTLFERGGRNLLMTAAGRELMAHVRVMGDAASRISLAAAGQSQDVVGMVSVTAADLLAATFLPPILRQLRQDAPGIIVDVVASNRVEDLTRRDADIAIRHVPTEHPDLIVKRLPDFQAAFFASSDYIARYGRPKTPDDLAGHLFIGPRETDEMLAFLAERGIHIQPDQFGCASDSGMVIWEMMRAGLGIAVLPQGIWSDMPGVEKVLLDVPLVDFPAWLATHQELRTSRRIRTVFDALAKGLGGRNITLQ